MTYVASSDGNGRTARLLSGYILDINGYGFNGTGSLEEYFVGVVLLEVIYFRIYDQERYENGDS